MPLAIPNLVSTRFGMPCARQARPYAWAKTVSPPRSIRTTPANPVLAASESISASWDSRIRASYRAGPGAWEQVSGE